VYIWVRVARWFVLKPKIQIWVKFGGPEKGKCWYILWSFGIFLVIWYILWSFGNVVVIWYIYFPSFLYQGVKKNLATLIRVSFYLAT
jgi:hypothetical protein